jgi:hypothetical protein
MSTQNFLNKLGSVAKNSGLAAMVTSSLLAFSPDAVLAQNQPRPDWAREFYGPVTFRLLDDPVYRDKYTILQGMLDEMSTTKKLLSDKQKSLASKNATKQEKVTELGTSQTSLADKNAKLKSNREELKTKEAEIQSADNAVIGSTAIIRVKENEIITLNNSLQPFKDQLIEAQNAKSERQTAYDNALQVCRDRNDGAVCSDDPAVIVAKHHLDRAKERVTFLSEQVAHYDQLLKDAIKAKQDAQTTITVETDKKEKAVARITAINTENTKLTTDVDGLIRQIGLLSTELDKLSGEITTLSTDVSRISVIVTQQEVGFANEKNHFDKLEVQLIEDLLSANRMGYGNSRTHGSQDGIEVARRTGDSLGERDGRTQGAAKGEQDGRARDFTRGQAEGETNGAREGTAAGREQGVREGQAEGFRMAGAQEGEASGLQKAEASDASQVGTREGNQSGLSTAQRDGLSRGQGIGESEAIREAESASLNPSIIRGPFAGTFNSQVKLPAFPGATGTYRNDESGHSRSIIRLAYIAGYSMGYDASAAETYNANIGPIYQEAYQRNYNTSYSAMVNREYQDSFRQGKERQFQAAYDREYRAIYQQVFPVAKEDARKNPDRRNSTFINAFKTSESSSYDRRYGQIREQSRTTAHQNVYAQNIAGETEKARQVRKAQVLDLYSKFPVVKFEASSTNDLGIRGVAASDSVYQPGEDVGLNTVIINYGQREAVGLKATTAAGETFNLPSIPGRSVVTLQGIAKTAIAANAREGSQASLDFSITGQVESSEQAIQGRHFVDLRGKVLARATHRQAVAFPFQVTELRSTRPLVLGETTAIQTSIMNKSGRPYEGKIDLELDTSMGKGAVSKPFAGLTGLSGQTSVADAQILIDNGDLLYSDLEFSIAVRQNGVLLGYLSRSGRDYLRVPYVAKVGAPVVVFNSSTQVAREQVKELASAVGGADRVSILDLSAGDQYQLMLDREMKGKTLLVLDNGNSGVAERLEEVAKTQGTFIVALKDRSGASAMAKMRRSLNAFSIATDFKFAQERQKSLIVSTNTTLRSELKHKVSAVEVSLTDLEDTLPLQTTLKLSTQDLVAKAARDITKESFLTASAETKLLVKTIALRNIEEALALDEAYENSKGARRFLFWKLRDKAIPARVEKDDSLVIGQLRLALKGENALAIALLSKAIQSATMTVLEGDTEEEEALGKMRKAYKSELKGLVKDAEKLLKKQPNGKDLINRLESMNSSYAPYPLN